MVTTLCRNIRPARRIRSFSYFEYNIKYLYYVVSFAAAARNLYTAAIHAINGKEGQSLILIFRKWEGGTVPLSHRESVLC